MIEDTSKIPFDRIDEMAGLIEMVLANTNAIEKLLKPGDICYSLRTEKEGWLLMDGREVSRIEYADLFDVIGTAYGMGDGSTTFNLPNCSGKFLQMDTSKTVGTNIEAGLPNITGTVGQSYNGTAVNGGWHNYQNCGGGGKGALYLSGNNYGSSCTWSGYGDAGLIAFDASRSNAIYGKSTTVQPPAIVVNYFIKY